MTRHINGPETDGAVYDISIIDPGQARERWFPLLNLADEAEPLRRYLNDGALYGLVDGDGRPLAAILVIDIDDRTSELRAVAVDEAAQGRGTGGWLVDEVCARLRRSGRRVKVGTASSGTRQLAFYQRHGFRLTGVERHYFSVERGYPEGLVENGILLRDMVWMLLEPPQG